MVCDRARDGAEQRALLSAIQMRIESGQKRPLRPSEAARLLEWAVTCPDPGRKCDLLSLFDRLGGLEMVRAALSDFD